MDLCIAVMQGETGIRIRVIIADGLDVVCEVFVHLPPDIDSVDAIVMVLPFTIEKDPMRYARVFSGMNLLSTHTFDA